MKTKPFIKTLAALAGFTFITVPAHAVPGALDTTFGTGGIVTTAIGSGHDNGSSVAIQADGKIVVAGPSHNGSDYDFAVVRYTPKGGLDTTFNGTGKVTTPIGAGSDFGVSAALQADGKILVVGATFNGSNNDFAVVRYTSTGTLDPTFNGTGKVTTPIGAGYDSAASVAVQADGKIVVAGTSLIGSNYAFALVRYTITGALDTTFNGTGKVTTDISGGDEYGSSVTVQADGKIVVAGAANNDFALVRYTDTGVLDTTFNGTGKVTTDFSSAGEMGRSVAVQADGKIVVVGLASFNPSEFALARYTETGLLDTTFNGTGKVTTLFGASADCASVAIQADGKIVVAGTTQSATSRYVFALARYTTKGGLDRTFNGTGKVTTLIEDRHLYGQSIALQADGKILVAGRFDKGEFDFALARYCVALPDTRLGKTTDAPVGNDRYNLTEAGQELKTDITHGGGVKTDYVRIQNDGPVPESFMVRGTPGNTKFSVRYLDGGTNVTSKVVAGTFKTGVLRSGQTRLLKAVITAKTSLSGQQRSLFIKATAASDPAGRDTAVIRVKSR